VSTVFTIVASLSFVEKFEVLLSNFESISILPYELNFGAYDSSSSGNYVGYGSSQLLNLPDLFFGVAVLGSTNFKFCGVYLGDGCLYQSLRSEV